MTEAKAARLIRKTAEYLRMLEKSPEVAYAAARAALEKFRGKLMALPGVLSVDVGMKRQHGQFTRLFAIRVHVDQKRPSEAVPPREQIPPFCDNIPTDVLEGRFKQLSAGGVRPGGGDMVIDPIGRQGTLGIGVRSRNFGNRERYLTCAHVISPTNDVTVPTTMRDRAGNVIGVANPNSSASKKDNWDLSPFVDCALITPPNPGFVRVRIPRGGADDPVVMRLPVPADAAQGVQAWKVGAMTMVKTFGKIVSIHASVPLETGLVTIDQIEVSTAGFAEEGDSGAILSVNNEALGIIRAVLGSRVIACPLLHQHRQGAADVLDIFL